MTPPDAAGAVATTAVADAAPARPRFADTLSVYLRRRVLIVMFLGFSSGLPLALTGQTLSVWMSEIDVDLRTIGVFALLGTPYTIKFLWAPAIDALDVPVLSRLLGRRRGWLLLTQLLLMPAIIFLGLSDPVADPWLVTIPFIGAIPLRIALPALLVATVSATQDIIVDAFRVESLKENEQAAGMASYVALYRVGVLVATAGLLILVSRLELRGLTQNAAWSVGYLGAALLGVIGIVTTLFAWEPEASAAADQLHAGKNAFRRLWTTIVGAFVDFVFREGLLVTVVVLAFVVLFKLTDALAGNMTPPFVIRELGFSRDEYAAIIKGVGFAAALIGGFAGGFVARAYPLATSLWIGGVLQAVANLAFSWQAVVGHDIIWLTFAITVENFTSAIGTVIFVAYLSALCRNPLHTAMQYALLTALSAFGRTYLSATAGGIVEAIGWVWFFIVCALAALPSFALLAWLQHRGHFRMLAIKRE